jgi:hypothetical protein
VRADSPSEACFLFHAHSRLSAFIRNFTFAVILGCALALTSLASAQETNVLIIPPKTKYENFELKTGTVLIKGSTQVGTLQTRTALLVVRSKEIREPASGLFEQAVSVEVREGENSEEGTIVDYDEIDGLIAGLDFLSRANPSVTPLSHFDVTYRTRGELVVSVFNRRSSAIEAAVQSGRYGHATTLLTLQELAQFRVLIDQAKGKLDSIRKR